MSRSSAPEESLNHPEAREYYFGENMDLGHRASPPGQPRRGDGARVATVPTPCKVASPNVIHTAWDMNNLPEAS